jgi:transposase-like protein
MGKFSPSVRERAVRMVQERRGEYPSQWAAIEATSRAIGCVPQTLLEWVKHVETETEAGVESGAGAGTVAAAVCKGCVAHETRIMELERKVEDLCRVHGMLDGGLFTEENLERPRQPSADAIEVSVRKPLSCSDATVA